MAPRSSLFLEDGPSNKIGRAPFLGLVEKYVRYYASGQNHTARAKRLDLDHFTTFLATFRGVSKAEKLKVTDWDHSSVQRFVEDCLQRGEAPATVSRRLATLKHMGRTLADKVPGFVNPAREVRPPQVTVLKPKALSRGEIRAVRAKAAARLTDRDSFIRFRNQVLFDFLIDTGLRADEVRLLRRGQVDDSLEWIRKVRTKGKRYRNVYITSEVRPTLRDYLAERAKLLKKIFAALPKAKDAKLPLFLSTYNADPGVPDSFFMGSKTLWRAIHELSAGTPLHPHLLRHSYALDLLDSSSDVRLVAQALGHSDVRTTMRYTQRLDEEVAGALEKSRKRKSS